MKKSGNISRPRGRPRAFDREAALRTAMLMFWRKGYAGVSIADLSHETGLNPPSLYAAFGGKQRLFEESVDCYLNSEGSFPARALAEEPTARTAVERMLMEAARNFTLSTRPKGCMVVLAATNCAVEDEPVADFLRERRMASEKGIRARIARGIANGELPDDANAHALAAFIAAVFHGMATKARDGTTRKELETIVAIAMRAWPAAID
jgi:TetR/AcrR family transcriptional regulator, copper-responsive repressor